MAGTERIRTGDTVVFCKVVAVAAAVATRKGHVRAAGSPCAHATLGPLEEWLDAQAGPGVIDGITERAVLDERFVKAERDRLLSAAFMIRVIVLQSLMPEAQLSEAVIGAGRGPGAWCRGRGGGGRRRSGPRGLAQGARPGAAGGTAGRRAAGGRR